MSRWRNFFIVPKITILSLMTAGLAPALAQSEQANPAYALLPDVMSPMEKVFWGERGLMRGMGYPLTQESREKELGLRRGMLTAHQIGGFLTLASMAATVVTGQILINGQSEGEGHTGHAHGTEHDHGVHGLKTTLAWTTVGLYSTTAILSLFTPPPLIRNKNWNSLSWHKGLAVVHFTGMFITPFLGMMIEDNHDLQTFHQVSGYMTLAALTGAMVVVTF
jgi:hypothetical protein